MFCFVCYLFWSTGTSNGWTNNPVASLCTRKKKGRTVELLSELIREWASTVRTVTHCEVGGFLFLPEIPLLWVGLGRGGCAQGHGRETFLWGGGCDPKSSLSRHLAECTRVLCARVFPQQSCLDSFSLLCWMLEVAVLSVCSTFDKNTDPMAPAFWAHSTHSSYFYFYPFIFSPLFSFLRVT